MVLPVKMSFVVVVALEPGSILCTAQWCDEDHLLIDPSVTTKFNHLIKLSSFDCACVC